jgi:DNA-binding winged helix-turn-helix (wHTH) protein
MEAVRLHFGDWVLDTAARQLVRSGRHIALSPKAFETLKLLIEERPRALSKREILDRVWSGVFVSEASLTRVINEIRNGLGDRARSPTTIRTVHAFGYAFAGDVEESTSAAARPRAATRCWLTHRGREFPLTEGEHIIGREPGLAVSLDSAKVSRRHARLIVRGEQVTLEDLDSKNGTFVRGTRIRKVTEIQPGDVIRVGGVSLEFDRATELSPTESETQF